MALKNDSFRLSIDDFIIEKHKSRNEELDINDAYLTHYLNNNNYYEDEAKNYTEKILEKKIKNYTSDFNTKDKINEIFSLSLAPFKNESNSEITFIDLFAGVGGFRLALSSLGPKAVFSSEFENNAKVTYSQNYGDVPFGDITREDIKNAIPEKFDILCGGFPCQAFSIAGHRKGFSDTRGTLFFDIEKIAEKHKPKVIFLENVKNLLTHDQGNTFRVIKEILEEKLGYVVYFKVLNSMTHANVPQNRERIFIVAFDPNQVPNYADFKFPEQIPLTKTIHDIISKEKQDDKYYYSPAHMYYPILDSTMASRDTLYQWRRVYVRENKNNVCPTLTANMGAGGHNVPLLRDDYGIRKLTPRECFLFQGYPEDFVLPKVIADSKLYMQAGNSVTMPLIKRIAERIIEVL